MIRETSPVDGQAQVFVSYAKLDAEQVIAIVRLLEKEGITVWRDGDRILGGQSWSEAITHAIAHSRVFVLMCSPHSLASDNVYQEVALAWAYECRRYIPVWLSPVMPFPQQIHYQLARCQWIDAHGQPPERWVPQLLKALKAVGVETKDAAPQPGEATPAPSGETEPGRRGLRFRPGDRPIRGVDWELEILLGKGGFGEVWKAKHAELPGLPPVALKFCLQLDEKSKGLLRHEADMVLRAQQQLRISASSDTSGIVPLLNAYLNNDPPCLEYPYIEGGTLVRLIDECRQSAGSFKPAQAQQIVGRVAQIVSAAHGATPKLVHRDLKPSNILVERRPDGKIVLRVTDFGIGGLAAQPVLERSRSSSLEENMASVLTGAYSPLYASPQQMRGDNPDPRDDVYALGVIWYQLLTSDLTSPAPTGRRWVDELHRQGMNDAAVELLSSCFERNPAHRPDDAGVLADLLQKLPHSASNWSGAGTPKPADSPRPSADVPVAVSPKAESRTEPAKPTAALPTPPDPEYLTTRVGQIKLKRIPAGAFLMGSPRIPAGAFLMRLLKGDADFEDDEKPQHRVVISSPFYLGVYEINQAQYQAVMGNNPSYLSSNGGGKDKIAGQSSDRHPVENVSWLDAVKFCNKLSEMEGLKPFYEINRKAVRVLAWPGPGYRLPTEAEWEYACRANAPTPQRYSFGDNSGSLGEFAWYWENSGIATHPVGEKRPNGFGLFDMHGNVCEWCWDWYSEDYYKESTSDDPRGPAAGAADRVFRGGCWYRDARGCRSAYRDGIVPAGRDIGLGFRVALGQSGR